MGMRKRTILLLLTVLAAASCTKAGRPGGAISFQAVSKAEGTTKTEYSGVVSGTKERIDWVVTDNIRIYCAAAPVVGNESQHYYDYAVKEVKTQTSVYESRATITPSDGGNGLTWGTGAHTFYAMYPATGDVLKTNGDFSGTIPATQTVIQKAETQTWQPNMSMAYMLAKTTKSGVENSVNLSFKPKFTAFSFTVGKGQNESVSISSVTLQSSSSALAGDYTIAAAAYDDPASYTLPEASDANKTITLTFNLSLTVTADVTFTVLALPGELTDMSVTFIGPEIGTRTLALSSADGVPMTFEPCKKYRLTGIRFPKLEEVNFGEDVLWDFAVVVEEDPITWGVDLGTDLVDWDHSVGTQDIENITWE